MGSKGGGKADTSGMEQAAREATALQEMIYKQSREDVQPWYQAGVGGINRLSDLLGISGGSVQDRQGVYDELLPQYTSQQTTGGAGSQFITPEGGVIDVGQEGALHDYFRSVDSANADPARRIGAMGVLGGDDLSGLSQYGFTQLGQPQTTSTTDFEALNAAVEGQMGAQTTPEGYGSLLERFSMEDFEADPSYQYRQDQAQKALERQMAAQGTTLGGGGFGTINPQVATALQEQSQGMASQEYGQAFNRRQIEDSNTFNRLMGVAGMGQGTTAQLQQGGQAYATNVGNLQTGLASAQQQAQLAAQSQPSMFSQMSPLYSAATGTGNAASMAAKFSDVRLKENIILVDVEQGHNIYEFDYLDGSGRFRGVMAHEVLESEPDAVTRHSSGYLQVNYDKLGLQMERV